MKIFFEYSAHDHSDTWIRYREENALEPVEDPFSPATGNEALLCHRQYPSDYCFINFIPAARGEKKDELYHFEKSKVFIQLTNRENTEHYVSIKSYDWQKAVEIASKYIGVPFRSGVRSWKTKKY